MSEQKFIYRYRSIDKLFQYDELEKLSIYFAKPSELNDQMEDYMNIVWQGDEIAFRGLFKHYLYTLTHLYYMASLTRREEKIDIEHMPIYISTKILEAPEMETVFKDIYFEFFNSEKIANIPILMAKSKKKFTADEILLIFKTIHMFAYLVINTQIKKHIWGEDLLAEKGYNEIYNAIKHWQSYDFTINALISNSYDTEFVLRLITFQELQREKIKNILNEKHANENTYNINILSFEYPELYIKQIKNLLYNNYYVACFSATYRNEPMWSHYANNENGICFQYKTTDNNFINLNSVSGVSADNNGVHIHRKYYNHKLEKVTYSNDYPEINFFTSLGCLPHPIITEFMLCNYDKTKFSSCCEAYNNMDEWRKKYHEKATEYICTKAKNWEYEEEYRIFMRDMLYSTYEDKNNRIATYNIEDLNAVIFGRKVSDEDKRKVIEIIQHHLNKANIKDFKYYDLYYSSITKQLELKPSLAYIQQSTQKQGIYTT